MNHTEVKITQYLNFKQQFTRQRFVAIYVATFQTVLDIMGRVLMSISVERSYTETEVLMGVKRGLENTMHDLTFHHIIHNYSRMRGTNQLKPWHPVTNVSR